MSFATDLLEQAVHLASLEKGRSAKQASLRRAVSAAYYALFHLISEAAAEACSPATPAALGLRVRRAVDHKALMRVSEVVVRSHRLGEPYATLLAPAMIHSEALRKVATAVYELQEARHTADYDLQKTLSRADALKFVRQAAKAMDAFKSVRGTAEGNVFLAAIFFADRWKR